MPRVPLLRPFRALRYDAAVVGDLADVVSPPYDVVDPEEQERLLARHPRNSVRLDLPEARPGDEPGARYRRAVANLVAWRTDGTLRKDPAGAIYVYEQRYAGPDPTGPERSARGFFARLRLEDLDGSGGVLPHERTMSGPKEDRYQLLKATGANLSPIMGLYEGRPGRTATLLDALSPDQPVADVVADDGVRHRLWRAPVAEERFAEAAHELVELAGMGPITLADGHHRYETALRYRDERRARRACPHDPPYEFVFTLLFDTAMAAPQVLPTHRLLHAGASRDVLFGAAERFFRVERLAGASDLLARFGPPPVTAGAGTSATTTQRVGLYSGGLAAVLRPDHARLAPLLDPTASDVLRWLPVSLVSTTLPSLTGLDVPALDAGGLTYTKDASGSVAAVDAGTATAAILLDPIPASTVRVVAEAGELMPHKSTYFWPKPPTGLLFSPGEW